MFYFTQSVILRLLHLSARETGLFTWKTRVFVKAGKVDITKVNCDFTANPRPTWGPGIRDPEMPAGLLGAPHPEPAATPGSWNAVLTQPGPAADLHEVRVSFHGAASAARRLPSTLPVSRQGSGLPVATACPSACARVGGRSVQWLAMV